MNSRQVILSVLVVFALCLLIQALPQGSVTSHDHKFGTIKGEVRSGFEQSFGPWKVIIEHKSVRREILTDKKGRFATKIPPGVYIAYVKPTTKVDKRAEQVPFRVSPGGEVKIVLDPTSEYVYCTSAGERVIPISGTDTEDYLKGLHRPKVDSFVLNPSDKESLKVVIEYCGKTQTGKIIRYKSPIVRFHTISIFADDAEFNLQNYTLASRGRIGVVQNGARSETTEIKAGFRGADILDLSAESSRVRKIRP